VPQMAEISPLRRRMIEDMKVRNLSPATQRCYVHAVAKFSKYFGRSPDRLGAAEVRAYQVHLVSSGVSWGGFNQAVCALRFFFGVTRTFKMVKTSLTILAHAHHQLQKHYLPSDLKPRRDWAALERAP